MFSSLNNLFRTNSVSSFPFNRVFLSCHLRVLEWIYTLKLSGCLKEILAWNRHDISKCNGTRTHIHLVIMSSSPTAISFSLLEQWYFRTIKIILVFATFMVNCKGIRTKQIRFKFKLYCISGLHNV